MATPVTVTAAPSRLMGESFPDGYVRPTTPEELRQVLLELMQGKAWSELSTRKHPVVGLLTEAAESLREG